MLRHRRQSVPSFISSRSDALFKTALIISPHPKKRSHNPSLSQHSKTPSRKSAPSPPKDRQPRPVVAPRQPAARGTPREPTKPEKMAKLSVIQYSDNSSGHYVARKTNSHRPLLHNSKSPMVEPGDYAILVQSADSEKTFLYRPVGLLGEPCVAEYNNIRPPGGIRSLLAGSVGDRDVRVRDVGHVREVIETTELRGGMSASDWTLEVLRNCEHAGYLEGRPSFP